MPEIRHFWKLFEFWGELWDRFWTLEQMSSSGKKVDQRKWGLGILGILNIRNNDFEWGEKLIRKICCYNFINFNNVWFEAVPVLPRTPLQIWWVYVFENIIDGPYLLNLLWFDVSYSSTRANTRKIEDQLVIFLNFWKLKLNDFVFALDRVWNQNFTKLTR